MPFKLIFGLLLLIQSFCSFGKTKVFVIDIKQEIGSTSWIKVQHGYQEAESIGASAIIIHMNTYGGLVLFADSIRTKILNSKIPTHVFIDNNAASAGALISIACDSIYMRPGANIGAATVVNESGQKMPDKYQSYMRATIRSTAEAHGKDTLIIKQDTILKWVRDPKIAEAMVDESVYIPGIIDTGKILTFTAQEAIKYGYCEGLCNSIDEVVGKLKIVDYELVKYQPTFFDNIKGFLMNPVVSGVLILIILGGIYFELQTPGIGFPIIASLVAAVLYFSPFYIDGLAQNWEIILFFIGMILIGLEVLVIPGFGVAGILGIIFASGGLILSMINNNWFDFSAVPNTKLLSAILTVFLSFFLSVLGGIYFTSRFWGRGIFSKIGLNVEMKVQDGYIGVTQNIEDLLGKEGIAYTSLRPSGKILVNNEIYDAISEANLIAKGTKIRVTRQEAAQMYVIEV